MSASAYSQPVLDGICRLSSTFNLTLPQIFSCQRAFEYVPHTTIFFGHAIQILLALGREKIPKFLFKDYAIGWVIAKINVHLFYSVRNERQDWRRFRNQTDPLVPSLYEWNRQTHLSLLHFLHFYAVDEVTKPSEREAYYKKIGNFNKNGVAGIKVPGCGELA